MFTTLIFLQDFSTLAHFSSHSLDFCQVMKKRKEKKKEKNIHNSSRFLFRPLSVPFSSVRDLYVPFLWLNTFESVIFCVITVCLSWFKHNFFFWGESHDLWFHSSERERKIEKKRKKCFSQIFLFSFVYIFENFKTLNIIQHNKTWTFVMRKYINQTGFMSNNDGTVSIIVLQVLASLTF